jgi:cytochrome c oxidase assembly protein subunit 15
VTRLGHRLAVVTAAATFVLILLGGLVTNTGSALAVPDWPTTFGRNMLVYPWSQMVGGIFYEHSHRLLGALVGLLTVALAVVLWAGGPRLRGLGLVAAAAVVVQGVLGGLRVVLLEDTLAIVHGCVAQAFFGLLIALAFLTSGTAARPAVAMERTDRRLALAAAGLIYVQIVFGALLTHAGWIELHLVGALAVFTLVPIVAARLRRGGDPVAAPAAVALSVLLGVQLLLGVSALVARFAPGVLAGGAGSLALFAAHRLTASAIFATTIVLALRVTAARGVAVRPGAGSSGAADSAREASHGPGALREIPGGGQRSGPAGSRSVGRGAAAPLRG